MLNVQVIKLLATHSNRSHGYCILLRGIDDHDFAEQLF